MQKLYENHTLEQLPKEVQVKTFPPSLKDKRTFNNIFDGNLNKVCKSVHRNKSRGNQISAKRKKMVPPPLICKFITFGFSDTSLPQTKQAAKKSQTNILCSSLFSFRF